MHALTRAVKGVKCRSSELKRVSRLSGVPRAGVEATLHESPKVGRMWQTKLKHHVSVTRLLDFIMQICWFHSPGESDA